MLESDTLCQNQSASSTAAAATVSPGWNDPPPLVTTATTGAALTNGAATTNGVGSTGRLHLQRQRRPVDPSIQCAENFVQLRGNTSSATNLQPTQPQQQQQQHFHHSRSFPQLAAAATVANGSPAPPPPPPPLLAAPISQRPPSASSTPSHGTAAAFAIHPASAFTPVAVGANAATPPMVAHSQSQGQLLLGTVAGDRGTTAVTPAVTATAMTHLPSRQQIVMPSSAPSAAAAAATNTPQMSYANHNHQHSKPHLHQLSTNGAPPPVPVPPPLYHNAAFAPTAAVEGGANLLANPGGVLSAVEQSVMAPAPPQPTQQQQGTTTAQIQPQPAQLINSTLSVNHHQQQMPMPTAFDGALPSVTLSSGAIIGCANNGQTAAAVVQQQMPHFTPPNTVPFLTDHHQQQQLISGANGRFGVSSQSIGSQGCGGFGGGFDVNNYKGPPGKASN